jgi:hypothetical protein
MKLFKYLVMCGKKQSGFQKWESVVLTRGVCSVKELFYSNNG